MNAESWRPRCALRVGVVGNRRFAKADDPGDAEATARMSEHAAGALDVVWAEIFPLIEDVLDHEFAGATGVRRMRDLFSGAPPRLSVLSSLAAGADQLGAASAFRAGHARSGVTELELEALLPFRYDDYPGPPSAPRPDFLPEEAGALLALEKLACQVVELPGDYATEESRNQAYEDARDVLLRNSDLLIAIYNPEKAGRKAGTIETLRRALRLGIPVIAILVARDGARIQVVRRPAHDADLPMRWSIASPLGAHDWRSSLRECVTELLLLPEALQVHEEHGERNLAHALYRLDMISGAARPPRACTNRVAAAIFSGIWGSLQWLAFAVIPGKADEALPPSEKPASDSIKVEPYADVHHRASKLAIDFIRTYRGAFVSSYLLAGVAVAAAVAIMTVPLLLGKGDEPHTSVILSLCGVKIGVLLVLLLLERAGHHGRFQEAGADFRYLAELLRPMQWLTPVGAYPPAVSLPLHAARHDPRHKWMAWLARAVARSSPCFAVPPGTVGTGSHTLSVTAENLATALDRARTQWIEGQIVYHRAAATRMHALNDGLEHLAKWLLYGVLAAAIAACVLEMLHHELNAKGAATVLGAFAAFLPAWIAALAGIAFQSEAKRLGGRSEEMAQALGQQSKALSSAATRIRNEPGAHIKAFSLTTELLEKASTITIAEAGEWKVLYQAHVIHAG